VINCYLNLLFNFCFHKCVCGLSYKKRSNRSERKEYLRVMSHDFTIWKMLVLVLYYLVSYEEVDETLLFVTSCSRLQINCLNLY
jgi:hypothetical protein